MSYAGFRFTGRFAVLTRPEDRPPAVEGDAWAKDKVGGVGGTEVDATFLNRVKANLENLVARLGGNLNDGDDQLANAIGDAIDEKADAAALAGLQPSDEKGAANGYASLDGDGKVPVAQLPAIAITDTLEAADQTEMLALAAEKGDIAIRSDLNKCFVLAAEPASTLGNWKELKTPTDLVLAVAGLTGTITAGALKAALAIASGDVSGLGALATQATLTAPQVAALSFGGFSIIASAATCDIGAGTTCFASITGTTTITSFGTGANLFRAVVFNDALTLTHSAGLYLPTLSNITTAAGDVAMFMSDGSGNWRCLSYSRADGTPLVSGTSIATQAEAEAGANNAKTMTPLRSAQAHLKYGFPRGHLAGLGLANNASDANNDIDIAVGSCRDSGDAENMILASALTKRLDAAWAVGTNQGGLDTGSKANSTWYHIWLIKRPDTGVVDVAFSTSASGPTTGGSIPSAYTLKRRIGSVLTDGSGNIRAFRQFGDMFYFATPILDVNSTAGASAANYTLSTPLGLRVEPLINLIASKASTFTSIFARCPDLADIAPSGSNADTFTHYAAWATGTVTGLFQSRLITNTNSQIAVRAGAASTTLQIATFGWRDFLGSFD